MGFFFLNKEKSSENIKKSLDEQVGFVNLPIIFSIIDKIISFELSSDILYGAFYLGIYCLQKVLDNDSSHSLKKISGKFNYFFLSLVF